MLRTAKLCRIRDFEQLLAVGELVKDLSALIHALQKERGASSVFLASTGSRFGDHLRRRTAESGRLEAVVRDRLEHVDEQLGRIGSGAQFYNRVALALHALDGVATLRGQVAALALVPQDSVKAFTDLIGSLLAVVYEAADIAADPPISRALVALFNFVQGKEFAGQERATAGAGFSRGHFDAAEHRRLRHLVEMQERAFGIFAEFADPAHRAACEAALAGPGSAEVARMRQVALSEGRHGNLDGITGEAWYEQATRRIDALKGVEDLLTTDLNRLCAARLAQAREDLDRDGGGVDAVGAVAMLLLDTEPAGVQEPQEGSGVYALDGIRPKLTRSILDVVQAQSRRIRDVSLELETARTALNERKIIDKAKGLLMSSRGIPEEDAYRLMRKMAMNQNKRIFDIAETILSMADILHGPAAAPRPSKGQTPGAG